MCYRFDDAPPEHCFVTGSCSYEPLQFNTRITKTEEQKLIFNGWTDPLPYIIDSRSASGIESYEIRINEVLPSHNGILNKVNYMETLLTEKVVFPTTKTAIDLPLPENVTKPRLFCLFLEVKDVADNVRQCRRFMLFDNSTFIETWHDQPFIFTSASPATNYTWQTHHHDICLSWKERFINKFYFDNQLFNGIEPVPHGLVTGKYDQIDGLLPVSGTPNVHGIVQYKTSWSLNHGIFTSEIDVPDFLNQTICKRLPIQDGETYTFNVRAVDIVGNTLNESRTVFIDRSVPQIVDMWLQKDGYEQLFVHDRSDLSKMQMTFDAFDPHSGLLKIHWKFGIGDTSTVIISEYLAIGALKNVCIYIFTFYL